MKTKNFTFKQEIYRKSLHLVSLVIPAIIYFYDKQIAVSLILFALIFMLFFEVLRTKNNSISKMLNKYFSFLLREKEESGEIHFTGATHVIFASLIATMFFSKEVAIIAISVTLIADAAAAIIGRKFGKNIINKNKSIEGAIAFFITSVIVILLISLLINLPSQLVLIAIFASIFATIVEVYSENIGIDDNLAITLIIGILMSL